MKMIEIDLGVKKYYALDQARDRVAKQPTFVPRKKRKFKLKRTKHAR